MRLRKGLCRTIFTAPAYTSGRTKDSKRIPVTLGFQPKVCKTCRGLPEDSYPKEQSHGRTSKIHRYYWREIYMETSRRFADWETARGNVSQKADEQAIVRKNIERQVIEELKSLHGTNPKYVYAEESQDEIIRRFGVKVTDLNAHYGRTPEGRGQILEGVQLWSPEEYVTRYYCGQNYEVIKMESAPFHALFGVFMWLLIQDPSDPLNRWVCFGRRNAVVEGTQSEEVRTLLQSDFGTSGYYNRRAEAINEHFKTLEDDLQWLFDYWLSYSQNLRRYLHAYRTQDVESARKIVSILPPETIRRILRYLVGDYWGRYLGWPDLFVFGKGHFFFAEVKSSSDKLSENQKTWIRGNHQYLQLPFTLVKIHKRKKQFERTERH